MKVLITAPYMIEERHKVEEYLDDIPVEVDWANVEERMDRKSLMHIIAEYDGIICGDDPFTSEVIDQAERLKAIVKWGTGIDSINTSYALDHGISVHNTEDAFTDPVADTTLGFFLALLRNLVRSNDLMKAGEWSKPTGETLGTQTVGVIGLGHIGKAVIRRLQPFGCDILGNDIREINHSFLTRNSVEFVEKSTIYRRADIITLHCDLNESSRHMINQDTIGQMDQRPFIVNTARGSLIAESDLIIGLENGILQGAALDVFEHEPLPEDSPLREMDNVILSSHNANSSEQHWDQVHRNSIRLLKKGLGLDS